MSTTRLSHDDGCMNFLEVSEGGLLVRYTGRGRDDSEAASVRSDGPMAPVPEPIGYFEAQVVDGGRDGYISVGLMNRRTKLDKLVGWSEGAVGYHGDDGNLFTGNGMGRPFGPTYSKGDIVGCGIDWINGVVFFTKNGAIIGNTPQKYQTDEQVFAAVGLRTPNETFRLNFGKQRFRFDLDQYISDCRHKALLTTIQHQILPTESIVRLAISHCLYNGYFDTVRYLSQENESSSVTDMILKRKLQLDYMEALMKGDHSLEGIESAFPELKDTHNKESLANFRFAMSLVSHQLIGEDVIAKATALHDSLDERILALIAYGDNISLERPKVILSELSSELSAFLQDHSCCHNELYSTLQDISRKMDASQGVNESAKSRRLRQLLNSVSQFIPEHFFGTQ